LLTRKFLEEASNSDIFVILRYDTTPFLHVQKLGFLRHIVFSKIYEKVSSNTKTRHVYVSARRIGGSAALI